MYKKIFSFKFIKYVIWWASAAFIDLFFLWFFTDKLGFYYLYSAILSFFIAFSLWFLYQKYITFKNNSKKHFKQLLIFLFFQISWYIFYMFFLWFLVDKFWFYYIFVAFFWKWIIFMWNYIMNYFYNFK